MPTSPTFALASNTSDSSLRGLQPVTSADGADERGEPAAQDASAEPEGSEKNPVELPGQTSQEKCEAEISSSRPQPLKTSFSQEPTPVHSPTFATSAEGRAHKSAIKENLPSDLSDPDMIIHLERALGDDPVKEAFEDNNHPYCWVVEAKEDDPEDLTGNRDVERRRVHSIYQKDAKRAADHKAWMLIRRLRTQYAEKRKHPEAYLQPITEFKCYSGGYGASFELDPGKDGKSKRIMKVWVTPVLLRGKMADKNSFGYSWHEYVSGADNPETAKLNEEFKESQKPLNKAKSFMSLSFRRRSAD